MIPDDDVPRPVYIRWRTFLTIVGAVLICFGVYAWFSRWPSYEITTVAIAQPTSRTVKLQSGFSHSFSIRVTEQIDGHASIETPHRVFEIGPGAVDVRTGGEYYENYKRAAEKCPTQHRIGNTSRRCVV